MDAGQKNHVLTGWLAGVLSQIDPNNIPTIDDIIGSPEKKEKIADPAESANNARLWGLWLGQQNHAAPSKNTD